MEKKGEALGARGQGSPLLQRPQHLVDQGQMRHSFSAGPELLRQEKRPRSGSTGSSRSVSARDAEAQIQVGPCSPEDAKGCVRLCRPLEVRPSSVAPDPAESRESPPTPQDPSPLRGTLQTPLEACLPLGHSVASKIYTSLL